MRIACALGIAAGLLCGPVQGQDRKPDKGAPKEGKRPEKHPPGKPKDGKHDCARDPGSFEKELPRGGGDLERRKKLREIQQHFRTKHPDGRCHCSCAHPEGEGGTGTHEGGQDRPKGNNGVGNGVDPQPPGNPPVNDGPDAGKGRPGNRGGARK